MQSWLNFASNPNKLSAWWSYGRHEWNSVHEGPREGNLNRHIHSYPQILDVSNSKLSTTPSNFNK